MREYTFANRANLCLSDQYYDMLRNCTHKKSEVKVLLMSSFTIQFILIQNFTAIYSLKLHLIQLILPPSNGYLQKIHITSLEIAWIKYNDYINSSHPTWWLLNNIFAGFVRNYFEIIKFTLFVDRFVYSLHKTISCWYKQIEHTTEIVVNARNLWSISLRILFNLQPS